MKGWEDAQKRGLEGIFSVIEDNVGHLAEISDLARNGVVKPSGCLAVDGVTAESVEVGSTGA